MNRNDDATTASEQSWPDKAVRRLCVAVYACTMTVAWSIEPGFSFALTREPV